jgi:sulfur-carrier protein adenylyltransferase/sulfurtransferase
MKKPAVLSLVLVFSLMLGTAAFAADDIAGAADTYFTAGVKAITADKLYDNLNDGDTSNDPFIVDVRSAEDNAKGWIPSATWMDAKTLFTAENLAKLPTDKDIVVYCYTGQTASQITSVLNLMGYKASNLQFGFGSWTNDPAAGSKTFSETTGADYPVQTEANVPTTTFTAPTPPGATFQEAANAYFSAGLKTIKAVDLYDNLNDGDTSNDPFILSVRAPEDYAKGHISGAVNVPLANVFNPSNLALLPSDKPIVVYCYTGQTGSQVTSVLNLLGYNASNLVFGMEGWTKDLAVRNKYYDPTKNTFNYPYMTAAGLTTPAAVATPAAPATVPVTGGAAFPVQGLLLGLGVLTTAAGLVLRRRKAA